MAYKFNPFTGQLDDAITLTGSGSVAAAQDGTEALPGISFANDLNTGIYRPGADQVAISTNGTGRLFVDSSGNVGVGASPLSAHQLTVNGSSLVRLALQTSALGQTSSDGFALEMDSSGLYFTNRENIPNIFYTNNQERLRITSGGKLGLGTTVEGQANADNLTIADSGSCGITIRSANNNFGRIYFSDGTSGDDEYRGIVQYDHTNNRLQFAANALTAMTIDSSGRVGVGTTSPGTYNANLAVYSAGGAFVGALHANASGTFPKVSAISLGSDAVSYTYTTNGTTVALTGSAHIAALQSAAPGAATEIAFLNTIGGGVNERARIDSSGRLLVGTSSSAAGADCKLLTNGNSTEMRLTNTSANPKLEIVRQETLAGGGGIGSIEWKAYDSGVTERIGASIVAQTDGNWSSGDCPSRLQFSTTADGASSPTEQLRITSNRYVRLASGTGGIQFNGDTAAANALDDYEEGTFTPVIQGSTTAGTGTYTVQSGKYVKVGGKVHVEVAMAWTAHTGTGGMWFGGLPFTSASTGAGPGVSLGRVSNIALSANNVLLAYVAINSTIAPLRQYPVGGGAEATVPMDTAGEVNFSATYTVV